MDRQQISALAYAEGVGIESDEDFEALIRFAALVAAHEREQCALVCDAMGNPWRGSEDCADAIRARTELSKVIPD